MKKGIIIAIIVILSIIILGLGGYIILDKLVFNTTTRTEPEEVKETTTISKEEAKELLKEFGFEMNVTCEKTVFDYGYSDEFKGIFAIEKAMEKSGEEEPCSKIFTELNQEMVGGMREGTLYKGTSGICMKDDNTKIVSYEEVNKTYNELYGENVPKRSFNGTNVAGQFYHFYDYVDSKDVYASMKCAGCGGSCGTSFTIYKVNEASMEGNELKINVTYYNGQMNRPSGSNDYTLETGKGTKQIECGSLEDCKNKIETEENDYLDHYEIVFNKDKNNYTFKSLTKLMS